jgi:RimJ/RimL family protein N-acetyltransferase
LQEDRISLRRPKWNDMRFIRQLWSDEETMRPVGGPVIMTDEEARAWFARKIDPGNPSDCYRLIIDPEGRPVGEVSYHCFDADEGLAFFNVKVVHLERGKGYAQSAMRIFLDEFFHQRGGRVMIDDVAVDNITGQEALLRFGFEHVPGTDDVFRVRLTRKRFDHLYHSSRDDRS